jgi:DNA-binding winged helix-turn-helix (wHTH) protein/tetratricopeptide (TPR) repeat protein
MPTMEELEKGFTLGEWEVLPRQGVLRRTDTPDDEPQRPENLVMQVLLALAMRDRDVVTQDELIDEVWGGRAQSNEPLQRCIALLRRHFGDTRPYEYIENLPRRGYRVLKPVELHVQADVLIEEAPDRNGGDARRWKIVTAVIAAGFVALAVIIWPSPVSPTVKSIAILPMENLSGDPANDYIVVGTKNSLAVRLLELPDFAIRNVRHTPEGGPIEIAAALGVKSVLFSSLQKMGERIKVTWQIVNGVDNITVGSGEVTGNLSEVFRLQEQLAQAVRGELAGSKTPQLVTRPEPASAAYNSFMRGMYLLERRGQDVNLEEAMALFEESIALDEHFGPAYLVLAAGIALLPDYRGLPLEETHRLAIDTVDAGVSADPSIEDAAASIYGFVYHQQKRWHESEEAHLQAVNAAVVDANSYNWYSRMLSSVGRREESLKWILAAEDIDPDNPIVINRIAYAYLWLGETQMAQKYFESAFSLGSDGRVQLLGSALLLMDLEQYEEAEELALAGSLAENVPTDWVEPIFAAFADRTKSERAFDVLDRKWADETLPPEIILIARTVLGDIDGAMEIARLLELPGEAFEMDLLFIPELEPLRKHPDFIPLMQNLGVVAYWESVGCVWEVSQVRCAMD